ncbi:MAG: glycosyltransferase family 4 protein [Bacteroidia bacterium]|nr:glycosyltransferase family 4 protein [Bacteroidia bacterium]
MRILQICSKPPYPAVDGGCVTSISLANSLLGNGHSLKLFCLSTFKHPYLPEQFPPQFLTETDLECVPVEIEVKIFPALLSLFDSGSYNVDRFFSPLADQTLIRIITEENFDCIILDGLYSSVYLQGLQYYSKAKIILRQHNIEFMVWKTLAEKEKNPVKKYFFQHLSQKLEKYEHSILKEVDAVIGISKEETDVFHSLTEKPCYWIPTGMKTGKHLPNYNQVACQFVGSMDWTPNSEGVLWFLNEIWPLLLAKLPQAQFFLAGRSMPSAIQNIDLPGFEKLGYVENLDEFWRKSGVLVAPLLSGGGLKIKIIEAMMHGLAVVTTPHGAEGLPGLPGKDYLVAENAKDFVEILSRLLPDVTQKETLGKNARCLAQQHFGEKEIGDKWNRVVLETCYNTPTG